MVKAMKERRIISLPLIVVALLFLFNPNIAIIDPLPDFIGYIILCAAMSRLVDIHERLGEAYSAFKKMIFIDGAKFLIMLWVFAMTVPNEKTSSIMLWSFVFAVIEIIFLIPAYLKLFDGITQIGYLYENTSVFGVNKRISYTGVIRALTVAFISVRATLSFLPELADLTNTSYDETVGGLINLYRYIGLLRVMAFIPVLVIGVIWLCFAIKYFTRICNDNSFQMALENKYETEIRPKNGIFIRRGFSTVTLLAMIALCFTVDIRLEDVNIFPDFMAAVFFALTFVYMSKYNGQKKMSYLPATIMYFLTSLTAAVLEYIFFEKYYYGAILKSDEARIFYIIFVIFDIIKSGMFIWVLLTLYSSLSKIISQHTGFVLGMQHEGSTENKLVNGVHKDLKGNISRALIFAAVYITSDICFDILAPKVKFMGFINIIVAVVFIGFFIKAFSEIQNAINTKYMLE